ncbi:ABC transporter permease [Pseudonocardia petroleophila]|uniref:Oligopeptide transport system permease protein OppC n=1 Tax=Pseudonocardia petroleophila TaxID=37331 RepID=A0A7G7MJQ3_9PSEU|nr:ABC transporter permease [Pseudonocardia petroleophila]QNG53014.1 ABC transporter permease [Pseudonocardia petroleophila]
MSTPVSVGTSPVAEPEPAEVLTSRGRLVLRRFLRSRSAMVGVAVVVVLFLLAYVAPLFSPWSYSELDYTAFLQGPSADHWFGTTQIGGDLFTQTMVGLQKSLIIGLLVGLIATALAAVVGAAAGYFGGWTDRVLMWVVDLMLVLPAFLVIAILSPAFAGGSFLILVVLLAGFGWMIAARIVRGLTLSLREREFVKAARFMGVPPWKIIFRHILPNMSSLLIVDATIGMGVAILGESTLSFFGFGVQPPDVSLGTLIASGLGSSQTYPWLFLFPAGFLVVAILAFNLVGDGLRDALDSSSGAGRRTEEKA